MNENNLVENNSFLDNNNKQNYKKFSKKSILSDSNYDNKLLIINYKNFIIIVLFFFLFEFGKTVFTLLSHDLITFLNRRYKFRRETMYIITLLCIIGIIILSIYLIDRTNTFGVGLGDLLMQVAAPPAVVTTDAEV